MSTLEIDWSRRRSGPHWNRLLATIVASALIFSSTACTERTPTALPSDLGSIATLEGAADASHLRLMTRNVYLGGDIGPLFQVDFTDIVAVTQAAATVWATVQANDFPARARRIAAEIATANAHVVGLQEASRFITLTGQGQPTGGLDYVQILMQELANRGLDYDAWVQDNTTVTLPIDLDLQAGTVREVVNFTDRIALLVRRDLAPVIVTQGNYQAEFTLAPGLTLKRGWIRMQGQHDGREFNLINTHLETQGLAPVQAGQAAELLGSVAAGLTGVTFLMGDLNSDAAGGPGVPSWTPTYDQLIGAGFADVWTRANPAQAGFTCCNDPDLSNPPGGLAQRIDFVLVRGAPTTPSGNLEGSVHATLLGEEGRDRTESGLWPSDHAGIAARLRFPLGLLAQGN